MTSDCHDTSPPYSSQPYGNTLYQDCDLPLDKFLCQGRFQQISKLHFALPSEAELRDKMQTGAKFSHRTSDERLRFSNGDLSYFK
jgi:hypothetical protein